MTLLSQDVLMHGDKNEFIKNTKTRRCTSTDAEVGVTADHNAVSEELIMSSVVASGDQPNIRLYQRRRTKTMNQRFNGLSRRQMVRRCTRIRRHQIFRR